MNELEQKVEKLQRGMRWSIGFGLLGVLPLRRAILTLAACCMLPLTSCQSTSSSTGPDKIEIASMVAGAAYLRSHPEQSSAVAAAADAITAAVQDGTLTASDLAIVTDKYLPPGPDSRLLLAALSEAVRISIPEGTAYQLRSVAAGLAIAAEIYASPAK